MADLQGWSRGTWGEGEFGEFIPVSVTGIQSNTSVGTISITANAVVTPTGVSSETVLGTAIGESESIYPLTGVQSNTSIGTVTVQEGHSVQPTGVSMQFTDGTATATGSVDAGWGRSTWGSLAWGQNFVDVTVEVTGVDINFTEGTTSQVGSALVFPTGVSSQVDIGVFDVTATANHNPVGVYAQVYSERPTIVGDALVLPTGLSAGFTEGTEVVVADANVLVIGVSAEFEVIPGTEIVASHTEEAVGQELNTSLGSVIIESKYSLTGLDIQFSEGTETVAANALATPTGIALSIITGSMRSTPWENVDPGVSDTWTGVNTSATNTWTSVAA